MVFDPMKGNIQSSSPKMEMDSVDSTKTQENKKSGSKYYFQWGWNPGTSVIPARHAPIRDKLKTEEEVVHDIFPCHF